MMFAIFNNPTKANIKHIVIKVEKYIETPGPQSLNALCGVVKYPYNSVSFVSPGGARMNTPALVSPVVSVK
jgi:hypothetical protein